MNPYADLVDYRRRVHELYARVRRAGTASPQAFADFVATRDALFARHPQSPIPAERRSTFRGLLYHPYDPGLRFMVPLDLEVTRTTIKGADLGSVDDAIVLDFNDAFQPSCAYDPRWDCPLAPPENRLSVAVHAGERYVPSVEDPREGAGAG